MSNLQVTREKLPTGTAEPQISGFFSKLLDTKMLREVVKNHREFSECIVAAEALKAHPDDELFSAFRVYWFELRRAGRNQAYRLSRSRKPFLRGAKRTPQSE
jgi:hypothetical protein